MGFELKCNPRLGSQSQLAPVSIRAKRVHLDRGGSSGSLHFPRELLRTGSTLRVGSLQGKQLAERYKATITENLYIWVASCRRFLLLSHPRSNLASSETLLQGARFGFSCPSPGSLLSSTNCEPLGALFNSVSGNIKKYMRTYKIQPKLVDFISLCSMQQKN
jgi:hypothetical protein